MMYPYIAWFNQRGLDYFNPEIHDLYIHEAAKEMDCNMREDSRLMPASSITAKEARRIADHVQKNKINFQVERLLNAINTYAKQGKFELNTTISDYDIMASVRAILERMDYTIILNSDCRNEPSWTIKW